jgi:hypothetical protein
VAQQAQYIVAVRMAARAGLRLSAPPEKVGPSETALRQVMEIPGVTGGFASTPPGDLATVNQMFGWWQSSVNDITAIALGGSGGGTMWIPGFDASSGYTPQQPAWGTVVATAPSTERAGAPRVDDPPEFLVNCMSGLCVGAPPFLHGCARNGAASSGAESVLATALL